MAEVPEETHTKILKGTPYEALRGTTAKNPGRNSGMNREKTFEKNLEKTFKSNPRRNSGRNLGRNVERNDSGELREKPQETFLPKS